uniref:Col_cuticle_N domain-containing protein n=1 Tax=Bursaphelenchus xylophilus TaxID=6326 RepID=A0A1I7S6S1_BURXY
MGVQTATIFTLTFSGATLLLAIIGAMLIYRDIQDVWMELDLEIDRFKLQTDDLWLEMVQMGAATPSNRARRQAYGGYGAQSTGYGGGSGGHSFAGPSVASQPLTVGVPNYGPKCGEFCGIFGFLEG